MSLYIYWIYKKKDAEIYMVKKVYRIGLTQKLAKSDIFKNVIYMETKHTQREDKYKNKIHRKKTYSRRDI